MRRGRRHPRAALNADINVTSLVDVAFVLLIIFMITAPIMQGGVEVTLPRAESRALEQREGMVVSMDRRGRIYIDDAALSYSEFHATFRSLVARRRPSGIFLRADQGVPYGEVARVLAIIRSSGVENVGLVTEAEEIRR